MPRLGDLRRGTVIAGFVVGHLAHLDSGKYYTGENQSKMIADSKERSIFMADNNIRRAIIR